MKYLSDVKRDYDNGMYDTKLVYPKPIRIEQELDETLRQFQERKLKTETDIKTQKTEYNKDQSRLHMELEHDIVTSEIGNGINEEQAQCIYDFVFSNDHSSMSEVFWNFEEQCELFRNLKHRER